MKKALDICLNVLGEETTALKNYIEFIETDSDAINALEEACLLLSKTKGRIIVSGMGKSGHVARKIASTFSSTGQQSYFVHPSEASHGDLGMIGKDDTLILLSNSGETKELQDILFYSKRHMIPIVAISCAKESTLSSFATVTLHIPLKKEACPMGLAPTTSTTLMLALGDALAITLLSWRGFSNTDFKVFHPGGKLGQQLTHVSDAMHKKNLPLVDENTPMGECLLVMTKGGFGCVGVLDQDGHLSGIVTDGDLRRHMNESLFSKTANMVMTKNPKVGTKNMLMVDALIYMQKYSITALFIVDKEKPIGIIHIHDLLKKGIM